jgi:hypothetical protein
MNNLNYIDAVIVQDSFKCSFKCISQATLRCELNIQHEVVDEIERDLFVLELTMVKERVHVAQCVVSFELEDVSI